MARRLALFLDGTTDTEAGNTNVWRLKSLCALEDPKGIEQKVFYSVGVGTTRDEKIRGGALGFGIDDVVVAAYECLIENYEQDDEVFVFGFSRGAYTARSLSGFVSRCGLITLGAPVSVKQLYDRYRRGNDVKTIRELLEAGDRAGFDIEERWVVQYCLPVDIKFTGVWDTVAALANSTYWAALTGGDHHFLDANLRGRSFSPTTRWRSTRTGACSMRRFSPYTPRRMSPSCSPETSRMWSSAGSAGRTATSAAAITAT